MEASENPVQGAFEENPKEIKEEEAGTDDGKHNNEAIVGEESKFEEIANKRDAESGGHNGNNSEKEGGTEFVERARDPIDKDKVDGKSNEN